MFTFDTIYPLHEGWKSSNGSIKAFGGSQNSIESSTYNWKVLAFSSTQELHNLKDNMANRTLKWSSILLLLLGIAAIILARTMLKRQQAEASIQKAEARKIAVQRVSPDCIITIDHMGCILEFNEAAEKTFGFKRDDLLGKPLADSIIPEHLRDRHNQGMERIRKSGEEHLVGKRVETQAIDANGRGFPVELTITRIPLENPPIFTGFIRDISDRKAAEAEIRMLSQSLEQAGEAVIITSRLGCIEYVNPAFSTITGYSKDEVLGKNPNILNSGNQDHRFYEKMWTTINDGEIWQGRVIDRKKDGSFYPAMLTISPITNEDGEITHFVGLQQNLADYEDLEDKFHQSQKMEAIGTLVGGIAHDFNNTLAGITGNLYLAKVGAESLPAVSQRLASIEKLAFRASDMIQQLLAFSRRGLVQKQTISMPAFIKETIKLHQVSIPENIELKSNVQNEKMLVHGDVNQLQQVMMNLMNNARDAVEAVKNPCIILSLQKFIADKTFLKEHPEHRYVEYAHISVSDNGSGISDENLGHIFEPFFTTKEVGHGTGLGLAMVYGAIHTHDGIITVNTDSGLQGTTFDIYLPLVEFIGEKKQSEEHILIEKGQGETILLVDDDQTVLVTAQEVLAGLNYKVITASNGLDSVEAFKAHQHEIALLILDVVMPKMGGAEALLQIRQIKPDVKVIFATGYDREKVLNSQLDLHNESVLSKPFAISELSHLIQKKLKG